MAIQVSSRFTNAFGRPEPAFPRCVYVDANGSGKTQVMEDTASLEKERQKQDRLPFGRGICIRIDSTKREVKTVRGACEVLIDWPHARRGPAYQATMEVLQSAIAGKCSAEEAHDAFLAFAKHAGVLAE